MKCIVAVNGKRFFAKINRRVGRKWLFFNVISCLVFEHSKIKPKLSQKLRTELFSMNFSLCRCCACHEHFTPFTR